MNICECEKLNPLNRDGTSQLQRLLDSLNTSYVSVDERSLEDLLLYIRNYSEYIRYVDSMVENTEDSDWKSFIENDVTIFIAEIVKTDTSELRRNFDAKLKDAVKSADIQKLQSLFEFLIKQALIIDRWYSHSIKNLSLNKDLFLIIKSSLKTSMQELFSFYKAASLELLFKMKDYEFSEIWEINSDDDYVSISADVTKLLKNGKITNEAAENFTTAFEILYNAFAKVVTSSKTYMTEALQQYPKHQPHFALLLSFLQLFKYAQDNINKITKRHLDFYYKDILKLKTKDEMPDQVHLIFELAKNFSTYTMAKGTLLKAGKDDTSVEVYYQTDKEIVVNTALVSQIKTVFLDRYISGGKSKVRNIYAAPTANSADGKGKKFSGDEEKWPAFGESQWDTDKQQYIEEENMTMDFVDVGFAVASPQLILKEGTRTIKLLISVADSTTIQSTYLKLLTASNFKYYLSGEKKWLEIKPKSSDTDTTYADYNFDDVNHQLAFTLILAEDQPEVAVYNQKKLGGTFSTEYPIVKILLDTDNNPYEYLKDLQIKGIDINVSVNGIKNLILQNDIGKLDAKKPFQPFGSSPVIGSTFYIGSEEIFNKKVSKLNLKFEWLGKPDSFFTHYTGYGTYQPANDAVFKVNTQILDKKTWKPSTPIEDDLFTASNSIDYENLPGIRNDELETVAEFSHDLKRGFIKLSLAGHDFCHKDYANVLTTAIVNKNVYNADANGDGKLDSYVIPKEPYTPLMKSITVDYDSNEKFDDEFEKFYHIYPFGEVETSPVKTPTITAAASETLILDTKDLLPQFELNGEEQEGILYIGISKLIPPQNLALLFQTAEGSGDPTLKVPEINWRYLSNNQWKELEKSKILSDTTNSFKVTGIIEFDFPSDATNTNTILPAGYHWLSACIAKDSAAINQMIEIMAQAVTASFKNNKNDPNYLLTPLEAETITKLDTRVPEIKSVTQPFASFGGKVKEQSKEFYRRVSERLRHKNRAVNIWDYERMVLEKFQSIYKVKCINHTGTDSEIYPGCVTVIPISNLRNKNAVDILEPRTSANTLDEIKKFLQKYSSIFITLEVENPEYEKIKTKFSVKFNKGIDKGTYIKKLKEDITKFLSPWAYDEGYDITFGGKIHASYIINFIEELSYIDYLTDFQMYHIIGETSTTLNVEIAETKSAKSILVSYNDHDITILE